MLDRSSGTARPCLLRATMHEVEKGSQPRQASGLRA